MHDFISNHILALGVLSIFLGGLAYRFRGMGTGTTGSREICLAVSAISVVFAAFLHNVPWPGLIAIFAGVCAADSLGHSKGMNYGSESQTTADAWSVLHVTGLCSGIAVGLILMIHGQPMAAISAVFAFSLKPVAYYVGWQIPSKIKNFETGGPLGEFFNGMFRLLWVLI